jgi:serine protease Do
VRELTADLAKRLGYEVEEGVIVDNVEPGSPAQQAEIQPGTLILSINQKPVKSVRDFNAELAASAKTGRVLLRVKNNRYSWYVLLRLN